ncbi:transglycosylase SLT domain-containing protein [Parathalassolituus penaei]|uniref:Transglycosylase SLT domain-containing protein n=1 Tax=Parathalassolituus penaei TaxID=2997323 RepID=A0A9X3EPT6_9GAMM|nr:transglycosylase SLT domain-containing protein [Parathalassolituus penaei]MCY0966628.1 transglycosylase SLT domain-containing protein [Parathalassolituus penaei]
MSVSLKTSMKAVNILASLLITLGSLSPVAEAAETSVVITRPAPSKDSQAFLDAEKKLQTAQYAEIPALIAPLQQYALYPHLQYQAFQRFPEYLTQQQINQFLDAYPLFPKRTYLQQMWLKQLSKNNRWAEWLVAYERLPVKADAVQCDLGRAYLETGKQQQGMALAQTLWTVGKSQVSQCDPLFEKWVAAGNPSAEVATRRYWLAVLAGETRLAAYLHRFMTANVLAAATAYENLQANPEQVPTANLALFPEDARQQLIKKAFEGMARQNPATAAERWLGYRSSLPATSPLIAQLDVYIGRRLVAATADNAPALLQKIDPEYRYSDITEAQLVQALAANPVQWTLIQTLIGRLPDTLQTSDRWLYWYARAGDMLTPGNTSLDEIWAKVAQSRSFYGFMAASRQNLPYSLNDQPPKEDPLILASLQQNAAIQRAREWLVLNRKAEAAREWNSARASFNAAQREQLAAISFGWGWYHQAIMDAVNQQQWNYLNVRFPKEYSGIFAAEAGRNSIDATWATAIARQESAFREEVVSSAGARGLMQLMPATAKATASKHGLPLGGMDQLFVPQTNIALGTAYLSEMYNRFSQNRAFASAAYNAGPSRVDQWLKARGHLPLDAWIETIPFTETRNYVQNVLSFRVIYGQRAGQPVDMLAPNEQLLLTGPVSPQTAVVVP